MNHLVRHFFEIRFKPSSFILDKRGTLAEILSRNVPFNHWNIQNSRIDFSGSDKEDISAFFSYSGLGLSASYKTDTEKFLFLSKKFIQAAWPHFPADQILRAGLRTFVYIEQDNFEDTLGRFRKNFLKVSEKKLGEFGGELVDIGFPLNFKSDDSYFNVSTGPMKKDQAKALLDSEEIYETGIFIDLDYFKKDLKANLKQGELIKFTEEGVQKAMEISETIRKMVGKNVKR